MYIKQRHWQLLAVYVCFSSLVTAVPFPGVSRSAGKKVCGSLILDALREPQQDSGVVISCVCSWTEEHSRRFHSNLNSLSRETSYQGRLWCLIIGSSDQSYIRFFKAPEHWCFSKELKHFSCDFSTSSTSQLTEKASVCSMVM